MAKSEVEELTQKTLQKGGILAKLYFDMESAKKEDLQPIMLDLVNNRLLKIPGVVYCFGAIENPIASDKGFVTNALITILVKDLKTLVTIAITAPPAGIEVVKPEGEYHLKTNEMQAILLTMSQASVDFSQYILSRVLSKEDYEKVERDMKNREELGRKILKKDEQAPPG